MLRFVFFLLMLLLSWLGFAQQETQEAKVKQTIGTFFKGFHARDTVLIKQTTSTSPFMQTVGNDKQGNPQLKTESFSAFLKQIASIPADKKIEERLLSFNIQVDGNMAHAWTPYEFYVDGNFSHCGVNSFQLFNEAGAWKIIYIIDTRRKDCSN